MFYFPPPLDAYLPPPIPKITKAFSKQDKFCLALNLYHEARSDPEIGIRAVGHVTLNRARLRDRSICKIVFEKKQFSWTIQAVDNKYKLKPEWIPDKKNNSWLRMQAIAHDMLISPGFDFTLGATFFYADYIPPPWWVKDKVYVGQWGTHKFLATMTTIL